MLARAELATIDTCVPSLAKASLRPRSPEQSLRLRHNRAAGGRPPTAECLRLCSPEQSLRSATDSGRAPILARGGRLRPRSPEQSSRFGAPSISRIARFEPRSLEQSLRATHHGYLDGARAMLARAELATVAFLRSKLTSNLAYLSRA